jgi:hypothetical protein
MEVCVYSRVTHKYRTPKNVSGSEEIKGELLYADKTQTVFISFRFFRHASILSLFFEEGELP